MEISEIQAHIEDWLKIRPVIKGIFEIRADGMERFDLDCVIINIHSKDKWDGVKLVGKLHVTQESENLDDLDSKLAQIIQKMVVLPQNPTTSCEVGDWE